MKWRQKIWWAAISGEALSRNETETETDKTDLIETMAKGKRVERPPEGVEFPLDENNRRSTMAFNAAAFGFLLTCFPGAGL